MRSTTYGANCQNLTALEKDHRCLYPYYRPWVESILIIFLSLISIFSVVNLLLSSYNAKHDRVVAVSRLEFIYHDLMKSEDEIRRLKIVSLNEERQFHNALKQSMKVRSELLKQIAIHTGTPPDEIDELLKRDPNY